MIFINFSPNDCTVSGDLPIVTHDLDILGQGQNLQNGSLFKYEYF